MLWRALKDVEKGCYVDVGANDPETDSVTKAFYDRGWRGINIEPVASLFQRLREERPEDVNLQLVAAGATGEVRFFDVRDSGLSTTNREIAERHRLSGWEVTERCVQAETLTRICQEYIRGEVHFLKIDVEGGTRDVIEGLDLDRIRPWIIVVEATEPNSEVPDFANWEPLITRSRYRFVYYDGLNRFYVADEHVALASAFDRPPNWFDHFSLAATEAALHRAQQAEAEAAQADREAQHAIARAEQAEVRAEAADQETQRAAKRAGEAEARAEAADQEAQRSAERLRQAEEERVALVASLAALEGRAQTLAQQGEDLEQRLRAREELLQAVFTSRSWRVAAPLRATMRLARRLGIVAFVKRLGRPILGRGVAIMRRHPTMKPFAWRLVSTIPGARARLEHFVTVRDVAARAAELHGSLKPQPVIEAAPPVGLRARAIRAALSDLVSEKIP